ncbi:hypothetical protein JCM11491_007162 [Sporobolomyces phaffii]
MTSDHDKRQRVGDGPRQLSRFELLPDPILRSGFFELISGDRIVQSARSLYISRHLLPFALKSLYTAVHTFIHTQCVSLYATLKHRPGLGRYTRQYVGSLRMDSVDEKGVTEKNPCMSKSARRRAAQTTLKRDPLDELLGDAPSTKIPCDTSRYIFGGDLLRDLFAFFPNLARLDFWTKRPPTTLFRPFPAPRFQSLTSVNVWLDIPAVVFSEGLLAPGYERFVRDYDDPEDSRLCLDLSQLPALQQVESHPKAGVSKSFSLTKMRFIHSLSNVFLSFTCQLTSIRLEAALFAPSLRDDLLCLPLSVTSLTLRFGPRHCGRDWAAPPFSPLIDDAILDTLHFGYRLPLDGPSILALVNGLDQLPNLACVSTNICHCPFDTNTTGIRQPRWEGAAFTLSMSSTSQTSKLASPTNSTTVAPPLDAYQHRTQGDAPGVSDGELLKHPSDPTTEARAEGLKSKNGGPLTEADLTALDPLSHRPEGGEWKRE